MKKDWSYNRDSHVKFLNDLTIKESYGDWLSKTGQVAPIASSLRHISGISDIKIVTDMTKDDEMFPGQNYWIDFMFQCDEELIEDIVSELSKTFPNITEDSIYYDKTYHCFFVTLYRTQDDNGPDLYAEAGNN